MMMPRLFRSQLLRSQKYLYRRLMIGTLKMNKALDISKLLKELRYLRKLALQTMLKDLEPLLQGLGLEKLPLQKAPGHLAVRLIRILLSSEKLLKQRKSRREQSLSKQSKKMLMSLMT